MSDTNTKDQTGDNSAIWKNHITIPDTPSGFTLRTTVPNNPDGVEVMLEQWDAGSAEPAHSHPGDDMTIVVEGKMTIQYYTQIADKLVADGEKIVLIKGDTGYIKAGQVHDAKYIEDCKLVYVHDKAFGFIAAD